MPAKDLGSKYVCFKCGTKFYDLNKPEPLCPKCGADQRESPALKPAPERRRAAARPVEREAVEEPEARAEEAEEAEEEADAPDDDDEP